MHSAVIGYGSIGKRHARILKRMGHHVTVLSRHCSIAPEGESGDHFIRSIDELDVTSCDYIVVANVTCAHKTTLQALQKLKISCPVLVEKPVYQNRPTQPTSYSFPLYVGYNLRFHPITQKLLQLIKNQQIIHALFYTGQHLAGWRPHTPHLESYSAHTSQGGGVLRDLSHEIDLAQHLLGDLSLNSATAQKISNVTVDSEDCCTAILTSKRCPLISLNVNYSDHTPRRFTILHTETVSFYADYMNDTITASKHTHQLTSTRDETYLSMHQAALSGNEENLLCDYHHGLNVIRIIEEIEA